MTIKPPKKTEVSDASPLPDASNTKKPAPMNHDPVIKFSPDRQVLHDKADLVITIFDPKGFTKERELVVLYNGLDVTTNFLYQADLALGHNAKEMKISASGIRIMPNDDNQIEVIYRRSKKEKGHYASYLPPLCRAREVRQLASTGSFSPPIFLISLIEKTALQKGFNPTYLAALVAQESAFDEKAVSKSKAIGLTQITSIAEQEISRAHPEWPRYPKLEANSVGTIKRLIQDKKVNETNEWRLDPKRSLEGSLFFLTRIQQYWSRPENIARIDLLKRRSGEIGIEVNRIMLASYHSGPARVKYAIDRYGVNWIKAKELQEARRYVNRIFSYCHHFSSPTGGSGDET